MNDELKAKKPKRSDATVKSALENDPERVRIRVAIQYTYVQITQIAKLYAQNIGPRTVSSFGPSFDPRFLKSIELAPRFLKNRRTKRKGLVFANLVGQRGTLDAEP